jgi:hypothetical protein
MQILVDMKLFFFLMMSMNYGHNCYAVGSIDTSAGIVTNLAAGGTNADF